MVSLEKLTNFNPSQNFCSYSMYNIIAVCTIRIFTMCIYRPKFVCHWKAHFSVRAIRVFYHYPRVLVQNNELKNQLAELQDGFVKMVQSIVTGKQSSYINIMYSVESTKHGVSQ